MRPDKDIKDRAMIEEDMLLPVNDLMNFMAMINGFYEAVHNPLGFLFHEFFRRQNFIEQIPTEPS